MKRPPMTIADARNFLAWHHHEEQRRQQELEATHQGHVTAFRQAWLEMKGASCALSTN